LLTSRAMSIGRAFRIVAIALCAITLVLAAVEVVVVVRTRSFLAESSTAPGQVVGLEPRQSCSSREDERGDEREVCTTVYAPRVRFTSADGRQVVFVSSVASSSPSYAEGDRVQVRYRPDRPAQAQIDTVGDVWFDAIVVGVITLVLAVLGAVWVVLAVRFRTA
jgi:preprotein translocase subunit SecF